MKINAKMAIATLMVGLAACSATPEDLAQAKPVPMKPAAAPVRPSALVRVAIDHIDMPSEGVVQIETRDGTRCVLAKSLSNPLVMACDFPPRAAK